MQADVDERLSGMPHRDPFGATVGERLWRRLAGAGVGVVVVGGLVLALWPTTELLPWVLLGAAVVYVVGIPVSWFAARGRGAPVVAHAVAAVVAAAVVGAALSLVGSRSLDWWPAFGIVGILVGAPLAALAAWAGLRLPRAWVRPVAVLGLVVTALALPLGTWLALRPPAPHDYVVVHEPDRMGAGTQDAYELAEVIAQDFERRAATRAPMTAHETWVAVGDELYREELSGVASSSHYELDDELPELSGSGQPVRLITTVFDGRSDRGCVVVIDSSVRAEPRACADLGLTG